MGVEECSPHLLQTLTCRRIGVYYHGPVFWATFTPKSHTTGASRHDRLRHLTPSVSFEEESIGGGRLSSNVTWIPVFRKQQLERKGLSQRVQNREITTPRKSVFIFSREDSWRFYSLLTRTRLFRAANRYETKLNRQKDHFRFTRQQFTNKSQVGFYSPITSQNPADEIVVYYKSKARAKESI
jgi:hypothetical protein